MRARDLLAGRIGIQSGGREYVDGIFRLKGLPLMLEQRGIHCVARSPGRRRATLALAPQNRAQLPTRRVL